MHLRNVPTCPDILGESARTAEPDIKQIFITGFTETETADRKLYVIRKGLKTGYANHLSRQKTTFTLCRCLPKASYIKVCCHPYSCVVISPI